MELTPYIMFNRNCEDALNFYAKSMDGQILNIMRYGDVPGDSPMNDEEKKRVMHSNFEAGAVKFMASDAPMAGGSAQGGQVNLSLDFTDAEKQEKVFNALAEGGTVTMPLQDTFWGAKFGMLTDKYGVNWMFNYDLPQH